MFQRRRRPRSSAILLLTAAASVTNHDGASVFAQQPKKKQQKPLQPLGDVLHLVLDKDKDSRVTMEEVKSQISVLEALFQNGEGEEAEEYRRLLGGVKASAPRVFELLDSDSDGRLTKKELAVTTRFEKSLRKGGGLREVVRDVFGILDADSDDVLTVAELLGGYRSDEAVSKIAGRVHDLFPSLRDTSADLEGFVKSTIESFGGTDALDEGSVAEYVAWIDDDGDGKVQRKEVGKYYNVAGRKFLEIAKTIKTMGPMMALFGGMDMSGGGGGGSSGFKMDL